MSSHRRGLRPPLPEPQRPGQESQPHPAGRGAGDPSGMKVNATHRGHWGLVSPAPPPQSSHGARAVGGRWQHPGRKDEVAGVGRAPDEQGRGMEPRCGGSCFCPSPHQGLGSIREACPQPHPTGQSWPGEVGASGSPTPEASRGCCCPWAQWSAGHRPVPGRTTLGSEPQPRCTSFSAHVCPLGGWGL